MTLLSIAKVLITFNYSMGGGKSDEKNITMGSLNVAFFIEEISLNYLYLFNVLKCSRHPLKLAMCLSMFLSH